MTIMFAITRALHFLSLMGVFGAGFFLVLLRAQKLPGPPERVIRVILPVAAGVALITGILWLLLAAGRMVGDWHAAFDAKTIVLVATATEFGQIALVRIIGLAALFLLCLPPARMGWVAAVAALLLASLGLTSHAAAAAGPFPLLRATNDGAHLISAGFWVGGLIVLGGLVKPYYQDPRNLIAPFRLFSRWGTVAVIALIVSGLINAGSILPVRSLSTDNAYADVLAAKVILAVIMIVLAVVNRLELVPALHLGHEKTTRQLAASVCAEILLGFVVSCIVGYLGQMAPS